MEGVLVGSDTPKTDMTKRAPVVLKRRKNYSVSRKPSGPTDPCMIKDPKKIF